MGRCYSSYSLIFSTILSTLPLITIIILCGATLQIKPVAVEAFPLSTNGRWIVDENGNRVKLACVNWVSHLETVLAEGLSKKPTDVIAKGIKSMGFNCVRLTWPLVLVTNASIGSRLVRSSFENIGLLGSIYGIQNNNPSIVDLPLIMAFRAVVKSLGDNGVMVILDNHVTLPGWCCSSSASDGNGFFGDAAFDPNIWITGLTQMATIFKGVTNVVGMSLRNALRGPRQNVNDWFKYMQQGAQAVHAANPDVLVILSGLDFDTNLTFVPTSPMVVGKTVYELHWYSFSGTDPEAWISGNPNHVCGQVTGDIMRNALFLLDQGFPLFVSEFGVDMGGTNVNDNRYLNCFLAVAAEHDLDWALWTLVGNYYIREGQTGLVEFYGLLDYNWTQVRDASFLQRIQAIQLPFRGPLLPNVKQYKVIFHPLTGLCVLSNPLRLGACNSSEEWNYTPDNILSINGANLCLQADGAGKAAILGTTCSGLNSKWEIISDSKMHLSSKISDGSSVCLDIDGNNNTVTNTCKCINDDKTCDPASQWFKLVDSAR